MSNKPVLDTPLLPNVKGPPTHKPWRIGNLSGEWHGNDYVQFEDGWRVTYHNVRRFKAGFRASAHEATPNAFIIRSRNMS